MITIGYYNDYITTGTKRVKIGVCFQASERSAWRCHNLDYVLLIVKASDR